MVTSLFAYCKDSIDNKYKIKNLLSHLTNTGALPHFQAVYDDFGIDAEKIITYLIFCYSKDSSYVMANEDWLATKHGIMELVGLDTKENDDVIFFRPQSIKTAISFLSFELRDWRWKQLITWYETTQLLDKISTTEPDSKSRNPSKNISDAATKSYDLKLKISALEKEIMQQSKSKERMKEEKQISTENMNFEKLNRMIDEGNLKF